MISQCDFLLCLGLLDYLEDNDAAAMLKLFWSRLRPGGVAMVGNFAPHCKARPFMEWIGNWYLIFRTKKELAKLAMRAGIPDDSFRIEAEKTGVDLILRLEKP